ncbi:MAG TPA: ferredoxin--NADP reductase [Gemmataceae bacterium]|nr:ferredoxin--NADP reductase [Gemmataceae bacterium]
MLPEEIADARQRRYNGTITWLKKPHVELMVVRVKPDFPIPAHRAGQYCSLGLGNWEPRFPGCQAENLKPGDEARVVRRAYSISHPILDESGALIDPAKIDYLEFYIALVREGSDPSKPPALTPRLFMMREGDRLNIGEKITGHYTAEPIKPGDTVLLLGTGTGEAPHNYLAWELLRSGHQGKILHACCVRMRRDLAYYDTHQTLMARYPNYQYLALTTREADTLGNKVYIQDLIATGQLEVKLGAKLDPARTHVYLCGNPKMIGVPQKNKETGAREYPQPTGVIEILEERGFQADSAAAKVRGNVRFEEYW